MKPAIEIRTRDHHFQTRTSWLDSRHCFSFGPHYDPRNTHHGLLLVSNDDVIQGGTGFQTHPHRVMEIVTWVLSGELEHKDSTGRTGIWHSEMNPSSKEDVHLVQMWVVPDTERISPGYEQLDITSQLNKGGLVPIASGRGHEAAISIRQKGAVLWGGRLKPGEAVRVPEAAFVRLYVAQGAATLEGAGALRAGDAVRLTAAGGHRLTAEPSTGAEVLVWETRGLR